MHVTPSRSAGARQGVPGPLLGLLCPDSPAPGLGSHQSPNSRGFWEGREELRCTAQGCQVSGSHGSTTQRCRDKKSVGVLMLTHQLQTDLPCSSSATAGLPQNPRSSSVAAGACAALPGALPAVPEFCASPDCSWGFVPAQHIGVSAPSSRSQPHSRDREERGGSSCYF